MSVTITKNLKHLEKMKYNITHIDRALIIGGEVGRGEIEKRWLSGRGGNRQSLQSPKGNKKYLIRKGKAGRENKINMSYTGKMIQGFIVKKLNKYNVALTFRNKQEMDKARSNYNVRPQMMKIDNSLARLVGNTVFNKIKV